MNYWSCNLEKRSIHDHTGVALGTYVVGSERSKLPNLDSFLSSLHGEGEYLNYRAFKPIWISDEGSLANQQAVFKGDDFKAWRLVLD